MADEKPPLAAPGESLFRWMILLLLIGSGLFLSSRWIRTNPDQLPPGITQRDYQLASEAFEVKYGRKADRIDVVSYLAELQLSRDRLADAVACFELIPTSHSQYGRMARFQQGRTLLTLHRAPEAEQQFRELIELEEVSPKLEPKYLVDARQRLRHILEVELRFEERKPLLAGMVERGEADHFETIVYCFPSHLRWNGHDAVKWLEEFHAQNPSDRLLNIALARYRTGQGKVEEARKILQPIVQQSPASPTSPNGSPTSPKSGLDRWATAALIACLKESGETDAADKMIETLPPQASTDPWLLLLQRGNYALDKGDHDIAAIAYAELLSQDPTNTEAWQKMALIERLRGNEAKRLRAVEVAAGLSRIQNHIGKGIQRPEDPNSFMDVADVCAEIKFDTEALILTKFAQKSAPDHPRVVAMIKLLQSRQPENDAGNN
jgi:tetratricopeptide (TPR) repeat protein